MTVELTETQYKKLVDAYHNGEWEFVNTEYNNPDGISETYSYRGLILNRREDNFPYKGKYILVEYDSLCIDPPSGSPTSALYEDTFGATIRHNRCIKETTLKEKLKDILGD